MNIEGRRSGSGFIAHKDALANALGKVVARRVMLFNDGITLERKGLHGYLRALTGNVVKMVPVNNGTASGSQSTKGLKVVCGSHEGFIPDGAWITNKTPQTFCNVRVLPRNSVCPNLGGSELAKALSRVLPFTSTEESKPTLNCVKVEIKDGVLTLVGADGYRLAVASLDLAQEDGEVLIHRDDVKELIPVLKRARRVRLGIVKDSDTDTDGGLEVNRLTIDTELVSYKLSGQDGEYPNYTNVLPSEYMANASFDTKGAIAASQNLLALWHDDQIKPMREPLTLTIGEGKLTIEAKDGIGQAEIEAETDGQGQVSVDGKYLVESLKACGGIVNFAISGSITPMAFNADGYFALVMPVAPKATETSETQGQEQVPEGEGQASEAQSQGKGKRKGKGKAQDSETPEGEAVGATA